jgi:hypothetical protein
MEASEVLKEAWAAVKEADLPENIQETAFREAIHLLIPVTDGSAPLSPGDTGSVGAVDAGDLYAGTGGGHDASEDDMYRMVAAHTSVDRDKLEQIVYLDDAGPRVSIAGLKLGRTNADRARVVAQILTITRGFGFDQSGTSLDVIRAECDRLKVYDPTNFSRHLKALDGYVINGTGQNRRLRAKGLGIAAFPGLVDSLLDHS